MMSVLFVPSSAMPLITSLQLPDATPFVFSCNVQSVQGEGHETATVLVGVRRMAKTG